ncbi:MAG: hypothetical protein J6Y07_03685 [Alphaproteobacteria bacterium]|nr:hypothetical protein [Alphaproteobacteria bacterium]
MADETCGNGWTVSSGISSTSTVAPRGGRCYSGYEIYTGNIGNFRFVSQASGIVCPTGQHMSNGTCVNDTVGNCAAGFHDATTNSSMVVQPLGGTCYTGYQAQQTTRNVAYLIVSSATTCGSGEYPTVSGCSSNPVENCPDNFFAPVPSMAFVRANANDECPTNYSLYGDADYCRVYLGFSNMSDFCTPQLACTSGGTVLHASNGVALPLYRERATIPSINIRFANGDVCYVNLGNGSRHGTINLKYNNQTYYGGE